jgi:hypothetical protein
LYRRVRRKHLLKQGRVLKEAVPLGRMKVRAALGVPQAIFMVENAVIV